jgi:hypothetical protein
MSNGESKLRTVLIGYFPMFIATLSLITSIYNGYLNNRFIDIIQRNLGRAEYLRTCKDVIDAYFQVKFRAGLVNEGAVREGGSAAAWSSAQVDAGNAVNRFAALGTYLANLGDETTRARYTDLSRQLEKIVSEAKRLPADEFNKLFEPADRLFAAMNDDCVKTAKAAPM